MEDCIFCKIINKELQSNIIAESEEALIFKDIHPKAPVHWLAVPKKHLASIKESGAEDLARHLIVLTKEAARQNNLLAYKLVFNVGREAGQTVEHLHMHLLAGGPVEEN
jgi:histidine triad (HIT) family protein